MTVDCITEIKTLHFINAGTKSCIKYLYLYDRNNKGKITRVIKLTLLLMLFMDIQCVCFFLFNHRIPNYMDTIYFVQLSFKKSLPLYIIKLPQLLNNGFQSFNFFAYTNAQDEICKDWMISC